MSSSDDVVTTLLGFVGRLEERRVPYWISKSRDDAVMVDVQAPGEHWEVEFLTDGRILIERYRSNGHIDDEAVLEELWTLLAD
jgi:hypothetical protein